MDFKSLARTISSLGSEVFPAKLLESVTSVLFIDHLALMHLGADDSVHHVGSSNRSGFTLDGVGQRLYFTLYYQEDPNRKLIAQGNQKKPAVEITRLLPADIVNPEYQRLWSDAMGIRDRLSVLSNADNGVHCCNLYRMEKPFTESEIQRVQDLAELLSALTVKHTRMAGVLSHFQTRDSQLSDLESRLKLINPSLTQREGQVCARILLGMTSEGIGLDLDLSTQTILTYRKRAYSRLNITSQNELFALCLNGVANF